MKYRVIKAWHGVRVGDVIETQGKVSAAFAPNVALVSEGELKPATPAATSKPAARGGAAKARD